MAISSFETLLQPNSIKKEHLAISENDLSGDLIDGGKVTNFSSTGITDLASEPVLIINDEEIVLTNSLDIKGTLTVKKLVHKSYFEEISGSINLNRDSHIQIGNNKVLTKNTLGKSIINSGLRSVGNLTSLTVGDTLTVDTVLNNVSVNSARGIHGSLQVGTETGAELIVDGYGTTSYIGTLENNSLALGTSAISSGKSPTMILHSNGNVGIGTLEPSEKLSVTGSIKFGSYSHGSTFSTGKEGQIPNGFNRRGDIMWNTEPRAGHHVGWVCIEEGTPGVWHKFGLIDN
jgi:hypothetical protein